MGVGLRTLASIMPNWVGSFFIMIFSRVKMYAFLLSGDPVPDFHKEFPGWSPSLEGVESTSGIDKAWSLVQPFSLRKSKLLSDL